jgi:neutral ceramidase
MNRRRFFEIVAAALTGPEWARPLRAGGAEETWRAGAASVDITPTRSVWMAGFAARKEPSHGVALPLQAKALAVQAGTGRPAVLVTTDLLGVTASMTGRVAAAARRRGLERSELLFNASHTHCGPVVDEQLAVAYDLSSSQWAAIREYTARLEDQLVAVIDRAVSNLQPVRIAHARGAAGFAANRRVTFGPNGPVDRSVPVLRVDRHDGAPLAIVFGYACHNTTLQHGFVRFHGDYAGVAQAALEHRHPGATAMFVAGCGADANPKPRGTPELVEAHGTALAEAVEGALASATPIAPSLATAYETVDLPFVDHEARARWRAQLDIDPVYLERYDALMQAVIAREGRLPPTQPEPLQVWTFGADLAIVALGGEVVVDYALRLARDYPRLRIWAAGYSNDVFGYVPSLRVLEEGGYEGGDAMVYYGRPGPFARPVENVIHEGVARLMASMPGRQP